MSTTALRIASLSAIAITAGALLGACSNNDSTGTSSNSNATSSTSTSGAVAASAEGQRCSSSALAISVGASDSAAGSVYRQIEFLNTSSQTCALSGFPGVSLVSGSNGSTQVGTSAEREIIKEDTPVIILAPGEAANADLRMINPGVYGAQCTESAGDALKIYPPDDQESTIVPLDGLRGCTGENAPATLSISLVHD